MTSLKATSNIFLDITNIIIINFILVEMSTVHECRRFLVEINALYDRVNASADILANKFTFTSTYTITDNIITCENSTKYMNLKSIFWYDHQLIKKEQNGKTWTFTFSSGTSNEKPNIVFTILDKDIISTRN